MKKELSKKVINTEQISTDPPLQNKNSGLKRLPPLTLQKFRQVLTPKSKKQLTEMTGAVSESAAIQIIQTLIKAIDIFVYPNEEQRQTQCNAAMALLHELDPQDAVEGMLCAQIAMLFLLSGHRLDLDYHQGRYRTMEAFSRSVDTLSKYRNKGNQRITVQHVNINEGANAVIGDVKSF